MLSYGRISEFQPTEGVMHIHIGHSTLPDVKSAISALALPYSFIINYHNYSKNEFDSYVEKYYTSLLESDSGEICALIILMLANSSEVHITMDNMSVDYGVLELVHGKLIQMYERYDKLLKKHREALKDIVTIK